MTSRPTSKHVDGDLRGTENIVIPSLRATPSSEPVVSIAKLEYVLSVVAYAITIHGERYAPLLNRLEAELETLRKNSALARAYGILEQHKQRLHAVDSVPPSSKRSLETVRRLERNPVK